MVDCSPLYLAAGANRHPAAADWDVFSGLLAYGSDRNIALWNPLVFLNPAHISGIAYCVDRTRKGVEFTLCYRAIRIRSMLLDSFPLLKVNI